MVGPFSPADRAINATRRRIFVACELCQEDQQVDEIARKWPRSSICLSDSCLPLVYGFLRWLGEISSPWMGISSAVDAAGDEPVLKFIMRHRKHSLRLIPAAIEQDFTGFLLLEDIAGKELD